MTEETMTTTSTTAAPTAPPATTPSQSAPQRRYDTGPSGNAGTGDPGGWSPQQAAAHAEMQELRGVMFAADGALNHAVKAKWNALRDFVYSNGPMPTHMAGPQSQPDPNSPATDDRGFKAGDFAEVYQAASRPEEYEVFRHGSRMPDGFDLDASQEIIGDLRQTMMDLKLPPKMGSDIIERVLRHSNLAADDGKGGLTTFVAPDSDFGRELSAEADRVLEHVGGLAKAWADIDIYMKSVLTPQQYQEIASTLAPADGRKSSMIYDPVILHKLLSVARARGIVR